ncbi:MAG: FMN-binding glutamate synthase family protein, partial [Elusimicrobia bacterium]|nr:FMN-binding glutamate synthase family protein [Elusimicrobiota bacterium]
MSLNLVSDRFEVLRDQTKCIQCQVCVKQCANEVHFYDKEDNVVLSNDSKCVCCHRCVAMCPTKAIKIRKNSLEFKENANWTCTAIDEIYRQAQTGGMLLSSMGNPKPYPIYWDKILLNASQVTNPSIDP